MQIFTRLTSQRELRSRLGACREKLYRIAYAWCHDSALADDLVQDTISKALSHSDQLRDATVLENWLMRILTNCWRDHFRQQRETVDIDAMEYTDETTPEDDHAQDEIVIQVRRAIAELPEGQRQVLTLVDLEGTPYSDVAAILGIPIGTVMSRLNRARQALRERLVSATNRQKIKEEAPNKLVTFRKKL